MSVLAPPPAFYQIEDRIDAIGQKYRAQRIVRGAMLWVAGLVTASFVAALAAHFLRQGLATRVVLGAWALGMLYATWRWLARPLLIRPDAVEVARFVESRIAGLHNGLTNGLLLSRRQDLASSPWLPEIFDEICRVTGGKQLGDAVKMRDLSPLLLRLLAVIAPMLLLAGLFPNLFFHGWNQLLSPTAFVPTTGAAEIIDVQPKDTTVVAGQPLEVTVVARCPGSPKAKLIFDKGEGADPASAALASAELIPAPLLGAAAGQSSATARSDLQYNCRLEHVDQPARYRVEVAGTQSPWYSVKVVRQIKLLNIAFHIIPPAYTRLPVADVALKADDLPRANVLAPQGSQVQVTADVDVPVGGAMLDLGAPQPGPMELSLAGKRFASTFTLLDETPISLLLTQGGQQVVARLPDQTLVLHCVKDQPPAIEMKWPPRDVTVALDAPLNVQALLRDDYGVASARVLMSEEAPPAQNGADDKPAATLNLVHEQIFPAGSGSKEAKDFRFALAVKPETRKHGNSIRVQVEISDNRDLVGVMAGLPAPKEGAKDTGGPQVAASPIFTITFEDPAVTAQQQKDHQDQLRARLTEMLRIQRGLNDQTVAAKNDDRDVFLKVAGGQADLRTMMKTTAESFHFEPDELLAQKVLLKLTFEEAKEAIDQATALPAEPSAAARKKLHAQLGSTQHHIIDVLETLLARLSMNGPTTQPTNKDGNNPLLSNADALRKLDEALKEYMKQQQKILDQTTSLAKKPVDNWDQDDKKKMEDLKMAQEKLDAFMQEKMHDFSKNSEQDMANSSALKQLMEVLSETTMAKDALKQKAAEVAVAAEENGIDNAKTLTSNIEKWLSNTPDRTKWTQEDPLSKTDLNMPELPKELEDLVGKLLEQQEDLFDDMEDANANWAGSFDKGVGWDAADGPIASMNAQGVTGNQLPNNNEMNGRSGEGRSGKSQGEFVEDHATGKGGRNTPTRLDPTAFQKGEVKDDSKDPTGGATGGGKTSGQGGEGLEGPVPPKQKREMERLAQKQAQLRNAAERLSLQYKVGKYDSFKLDEAIGLMRRVESDLHANRYVNALRRRDVTLDALDTSRLLVGGEVHVQRDTTPTTSKKNQEQINDAMKGELPPAWSDALKEYYRKLGE